MTFGLNFARGYTYFGDIHPKTESQYRYQKALAGILPGYGNWMESRAYDEQAANLRNRLGIGWSNIKSPWVADLSGNTAMQAGTAMVSRNLSRLYADYPVTRKEPEKRAHFSGRYGGRHRR